MKTLEIGKYSFSVIREIGALSGDGIFVYSLSDKKVLYCNHAFAKIAGDTKAKLMKASYMDLRRLTAESDDFLEKTFFQLRTSSHVSNIELRLSKDQNRFLSCDAFLLKDESSVVCIAKDITKSKEHLNYIVEFGARKDTILDMVAHNLSGPLNVTSNLLDVVDQASQAYKGHQLHSYTRLIRENTQHCIEIINSFLKEEHLVSEKISIERNRFDVIQKIKVVIERVKEFGTAKEIGFSSNAKEIFTTSDDVKFFQVVHNIVSNSLKFTPDHGIIKVNVTDLDESFRVEISDNGIGIPEHLQPYIFQRNTPAGRPGLKGEKSIGMGLYIVKKLVDLLKGQIDFKSTELVGTTFTLVFPKT